MILLYDFHDTSTYLGATLARMMRNIKTIHHNGM
jgi:hypothetical protein